MSKSVVRARKFAAQRQRHRCYYCGVPMWLNNAEKFTAMYGVSKRQVPLLKCTAEHVVARSEGGSNARSNIVAACCYCNQKRHARSNPPDADSYKKLVKRRVSKGRWLHASLPKTLRDQVKLDGVLA